jgi:hypothetical protein
MVEVNLFHFIINAVELEEDGEKRLKDLDAQKERKRKTSTEKHEERSRSGST